MDRVNGKPRLATVWLGGCSGCHMSFLDLDEWLIDLAAATDIVFSPVMDVKQYPEHVDVALVEGAVANEDHLEMIRKVPRHTRVLVAFGDCAVTGNVTALRNSLGKAEEVLRRSYLEGADIHGADPSLAALVATRTGGWVRWVRQAWKKSASTSKPAPDPCSIRSSVFSLSLPWPSDTTQLSPVNQPHVLTAMPATHASLPGQSGVTHSREMKLAARMKLLSLPPGVEVPP